MELHNQMLSLAQPEATDNSFVGWYLTKPFFHTLLRDNYTCEFPGGSFFSLQIAAFWLSWARLRHTRTSPQHAACCIPATCCRHSHAHAYAPAHCASLQIMDTCMSGLLLTPCCVIFWCWRFAGDMPLCISGDVVAILNRWSTRSDKVEDEERELAKKLYDNFVQPLHSIPPRNCLLTICCVCIS